MTKSFIILMFLFLINNSIISQNCNIPTWGQTEVIFQNNSSNYIEIIYYPVSALYTNTSPSSGDQIYTLQDRFKPDNIDYIKIIGGQEINVEARMDYLTSLRIEKYTYLNTEYILKQGGIELTATNPNNRWVGLNYDPAGNGQPDVKGTIGNGLYKFVFSWGTAGNENYGSDACYLEMNGYIDGNSCPDLAFIVVNGPNNQPEIYYKFTNGVGCVNVPCQPISSVNKHIKTWQPYIPSVCTTRTDKDFGNFRYKSDNTYNKFPLDPREDCNLNDANIPIWARDQNITVAESNTFGKLIYNLTLEKSLSTPTTGNRNDIILLPELTNQQDPKGPFLKIASSKTFSLNSFSGQTYGTDIIVNEKCKLWLDAGSVSQPTILNVNQNCKVLLKQYSELLLGANSELRINEGGYFCSECAYIHGPGRIKIKKLSQFCQSNCDNLDFIDSTEMILEDSAIWTVDPNTIVTFDGQETLLQLGQYSQIKFGHGSKLILKNGARISANNCKFTSLDSNGTWDGIYIEDNANDTILNCTIENAYNGINISGGNSFFDPYSTEITGCTFSNITDTQLVSCIYVNSSDGILIRDCIVESEMPMGYSVGIITEYCPTNGVVIIDNEINNSTTGIAVIQSSPYIARNIITGLSGTGTGILLDNSNGTIEYNIVNNFQKSFSASYSSPYLLKNTFADASSKNMDLTSNSNPVMKPVVSNSSLRWLGGNNTIIGSPSNSGIAFTDCYPLMDSGYNRIIVNGSDYLNGIFSKVYTTVNARINYWYDSPPQSSLFDVSFGSVNYDYYFDGNTIPSTSGYELNSLGFGLFDTVFTNELGDTPTPEDLFMQAYVNEMQTQYSDAIGMYKEVVSSYKTSSYAPVSLSRIFNCLEKNESSGTDYQAIQNYYSSIRMDTNNLTESRELSEDFIIKSKVKQGLFEDAIMDYDNMYQQNTNNSKGQHALINKLCLLNMSHGGDNPSNGSSNSVHKINLLSLLQGSEIRSNSSITSNITPISFKLHQNYPNPFNPQTTIKYDVPHDNFVTIKIYDLLGREIFNSGEFKKAGSYEVKFDGTNFASGMYFYSLESKDFRDTKKMVLLK